jgi:hypothetical protein
MQLFQVAQGIEASHIGTAIRESMWAFPILNLVHLLGLMVAAGTIVYWDLRLLGWASGGRLFRSWEGSFCRGPGVGSASCS